MSKLRTAKALLFLFLPLTILACIAWHLLSAPPITVVGNFSKQDVAQIKSAVHRSIMAALPRRHLSWVPFALQSLVPDLSHPITWIARMPDGTARAWYRVTAAEGAIVGIWFTGTEHRWGQAECRLYKGPDGWLIGSPPVMPVAVSMSALRPLTNSTGSNSLKARASQPTR
jgi:hypothetical protein